jgi:hypothetical protein
MYPLKQSKQQSLSLSLTSNLYYIQSAKNHVSYYDISIQYFTQIIVTYITAFASHD